MLGIAMVALSACGHVQTSGTPGAGSSTLVPGVDAATMAKLQAAAQHIASECNAQPVGAVAVATTSGEAYHGEAAGPQSEAIYVIAMSGNFTCPSFPRPLGMPPLTGIELTVGVDAKTFEIVSYGLLTRPMNLNSLGTPFSLTG